MGPPQQWSLEEIEQQQSAAATARRTVVVFSRRSMSVARRIFSCVIVAPPPRSSRKSREKEVGVFRAAVVFRGHRAAAVSARGDERADDGGVLEPLDIACLQDLGRHVLSAPAQKSMRVVPVFGCRIGGM